MYFKYKIPIFRRIVLMNTSYACRRCFCEGEQSVITLDRRTDKTPRTTTGYISIYIIGTDFNQYGRASL